MAPRQKHPHTSLPPAQAADTTVQHSPPRTSKSVTPSPGNTGNNISEKHNQRILEPQTPYVHRAPTQQGIEREERPFVSDSGALGKFKKRKDSDTSSIRSSPGTTKGDTSLRKMWFPLFNFKKNPKPQVLAQTPSSPTPQRAKTDLKETDIVIALMGPTGSGKSSFISKVTGVDRGVGHGLESCTSKIETIPIRIPTREGDVEAILVDTPGFGDTHKSDYEIFQLISNWLKQAGDKKVLLDGILYLHRISDNRMAGPPLRNLSAFKKLCGAQGYARVIMVTTMWDALDSEEIGDRREEELKSEFWAPMIKRGSTTKRYRNTRDSACHILQRFTGTSENQPGAIHLPKEAVEVHHITGAGRVLETGERSVVPQSSEEGIRRSREVPNTDVSQDLAAKKQLASPPSQKERAARTEEPPIADVKQEPLHETKLPVPSLPNDAMEHKRAPHNTDAIRATTSKKQPAPIQLQKEMVKYTRALPNTDAGQELLVKIDELDKRRKKLMRTLKKQIDKPGTDADIVKLLQDQYQGLEKEHQAALQELGSLKVSAPQRIQKALGIKARTRN